MSTQNRNLKTRTDMSLINFLMAQCKKHLETYHFRQIETPILEQAQLYAHSHNYKQLCAIQPAEDSNESLILRPAANNSIIQSYIHNKINETPWKIYTHGPMFNRQQECHQSNLLEVEVVGSSAPSHDVYLIKMFDRFFHEILLLNNYSLALNFLGCLNDRLQYSKKIKKFLESQKTQTQCSICTEHMQFNMLQIFECKNKNCQAIYQNAPRLIDNLCTTCALEWAKVQEQLEMLSVTFTINSSLIGNADCDNKTVFEFSSQQINSRISFCRGGRQNRAAEHLGLSHDIPSVGGSLDIEQFLVMLEPMHSLLDIPQEPVLHVIMPINPEQQVLALLLADTLAASGLAVDIYLEGDSLKNMMFAANKMGTSWGLILGPEEQENRTVRIKNMMTGVENTVAQADAANFLKR